MSPFNGVKAVKATIPPSSLSQVGVYRPLFPALLNCLFLYFILLMLELLTQFSVSNNEKCYIYGE